MSDTHKGYTPAPWRVEHGTYLVWGECGNNRMGIPIMQAHTHSRDWGRAVSEDEHEANMRLAASAPELLAERDALKAEVAALRAFAQKICAGYLGVGEEIGDIDGATIQEWAAEVGLLKATPTSEPCGEGCVCAEVYTPGESWECYRPTPLLTGEPEGSPNESL